MRRKAYPAWKLSRPVPEPSAGLLVAIGLAGLAARRRCSH
jgi:hypothetical protein